MGAESNFAGLISNSLYDLANMADSSTYAEAREAVSIKRDRLEDVRHELIAKELKNRAVLNP